MENHSKDLTEKWEIAKKDFPEIKGSEDVVQENWERLELLSLLFIYTLIK